MEKKSIGSFIAALRKAKGLTQRQLADMLNVSDKAVSRWERDETAPDLSLIPILADIFNVTSDEILRGQRSAPDETGNKYEIRQTEKQKQHLLNRSRTQFQMLCVITTLIALCGLIAAMICNVFNRANLGFYVSLVFYAAAAACQTIFLINAKANMQNSEISGVDTVIKELITLSQAVYTLIIALFAATLPLLTHIADAYWGLSGRDWLVLGLLHGAIGIVVAQLVIYIINCRLGYASSPNFKTPKNKLRIRMLVSLCLILAVTFAAHVTVHGLLEAYPYYISEGTRWDTWEELKEYLETPLSPHGEEMELLSANNGTYQYIDPSGTIHYAFEDSKAVLIYESDMQTPKYEYVHKNFYVSKFSYSNTEDHLPIYTYSPHQLTVAENKLVYINLGICALYIVEILCSTVIYIRKMRKL